jgi:hypothetical protein
LCDAQFVHKKHSAVSIQQSVTTKVKTFTTKSTESHRGTHTEVSLR